ncbi:hypothetical protein FHW58_003197 [Duganella sp. 1224]|uniref:hypothetical protein n=1 Tax=Duganella sp. 1224 TaxID=2587052 RepID=UPI0015CD6718|nr:hypothetical protein [Duganella sp. 1224]NYE61990.1 hypothetical protein [Duganella sp. 1224]
MSGPKVVRIVTREEIIAICENLLRQLDQTIATWTSEGHRIKELSDAEIASTLLRKQELGDLLAQEAFAELQKNVPDEIEYLHTDLERRRQRSVEKLVHARQRRRQGERSATTLIRALEVRGIVVPAALRNLAAGEEVADIDAVLADGLAMLNPMASGLTDVQREQARKLMTEVPEIGAWESVAIANPRIERIDQQIAELHTLLGVEQAAAFNERLRTIETKTVDAHQHLLLDSLIVDLAAALKEMRSQRTIPTEATPPAVDERFAEARRKAILNGLAHLGYEVHEGMETAWASNGHIVAKKPSLPDYGVEIGGQAQTGRIQVRTVALTENRDTRRDKDVETLWCGEFSRLQDLLAQEGDALIVERALGVGTVPLKLSPSTRTVENLESKSRTFP